ncbi:hypothetical protein [Brevundimonas sp.]|uniref:hypothetical protein n=1 Tax=Brevundimonas sp. TaxID=1871086 RepID=UPI00391BABAD
MTDQPVDRRNEDIEKAAERLNERADALQHKDRGVPLPEDRDQDGVGEAGGLVP